MKFIKILLFLCFPTFLVSQDCKIVLNGAVKDGITGKTLEHANISIEELKKNTTTDKLGTYKITSICKGKYHIKLSHLGCESQRIFIELSHDTTINFTLNHFSHSIEGAVITAKSTKKNIQEVQTINEQKINENANKNLGNILESITGVNTLKNGNAISKPIVHGLYGNRLLIVNNGISQNGQQWGNDHSPEIDPFIANKITVIKGVSALEYMGSSLGSVILIEPKKIQQDPHLHGKINYFFETNGYGNGLNIQLEKYTKHLSWKLTGTVKKNGDKKTNEYYLRNTGSQEANFALQLEKKQNEQWASDLFLSTFNTELGVLRGSHIGNLTDLNEALTRDKPFYTEDNFSYAINAPKQIVQHHLLKFHSKYLFKNLQAFDFSYATQINNRKEFDIRRGNRSEIPALSLLQISHFIEGKHFIEFKNKMSLKSGIQLNITNNTNNPETGIHPLIPDFLEYESGIFALLQKKYEKLALEIGGRYDFKYQSVVAISNTLPSYLQRYTNIFHNISSSIGANYFISNKVQLNYNIGFIERNPGVNELYSGGLHQGVSGIEEGDPTLKSEQSLKSTISIQGRVKEKLFFESLFYFQNINNYIYLKPQEEVRVTIRGAFPVFKYEQTRAQIYGLDFSGTYNFLEDFSATLKSSFIKGMDVTQNIPLIFMPSNNINLIIHHHIHKILFLNDVEFELNGKHVFKQSNLLANQDYVLPPDAYSLFGFKISTHQIFKKIDLKNYIKIDNVLNTKYRDYLNRQHYFANDLGINIIIGTTVIL